MNEPAPTPRELFDAFRRDGSFRPSTLASYASISTGPLPTALLQCETYKAPLVIFPLCRAGWQSRGSTPLSDLTAFSDMFPDDAHAAIAKSSAWGPRAVGCVSAASWRDASIAAEMRLARFFGLRAVLVPLPGDESEERAAAEAIAAHVRSGRETAVWVSCDAAAPEHRAAFARLRTAALWGTAYNNSNKNSEHNKNINNNNSNISNISNMGVCETDVLQVLRREAVGRVVAFLRFSSVCGALPAEWLGEPVAAFDVPDARRMTVSLRAGDDGRAAELPADVMPLSAALWATAQPPFLSFAAFIIELLRRRAMPAFGVDFFFDAYAMINHLYVSCVVDAPRDYFSGFEDVLQLPLQPLGHMLPGCVYEVFEQDRAKYVQYNMALSAYFSEWDDALSHARHSNKGSDPYPPRTAFVVLLGAGRGPLISECLDAATRAGVRVRLFALEKNPDAADIIALRLRGDRQWREWCDVNGHSVSITCVDGRALRSSSSSSLLPSDFGLCDLLVSELLGSFGDNELSPECLDGFCAELRALQLACGLSPNPSMVSIPSSYTACAAPLHSGRFEEAVAEAAAGGLTVRSQWCADRHAALFHSMFVSNTSSGVALAQPQPCWMFEHIRDEPQAMVREATLRFVVSSAGRLSGFIGFFRAVLYEPKSAAAGAATIIATTPDERTPGMFSWFPSLLALEPRDMMEVEAGDEVRLTLQRNVCDAEQRVWYAYQSSVHRGAEGREVARSALINKDGWAASVLLSS